MKSLKSKLFWIGLLAALVSSGCANVSVEEPEMCVLWPGVTLPGLKSLGFTQEMIDRIGDDIEIPPVELPFEHDFSGSLKSLRSDNVNTEASLRVKSFELIGSPETKFDSIEELSVTVSAGKDVKVPAGFPATTKVIDYKRPDPYVPSSTLHTEGDGADIFSYAKLGPVKVLIRLVGKWPAEDWEVKTVRFCVEFDSSTTARLDEIAKKEANKK